jgi:hypothetical protein
LAVIDKVSMIANQINLGMTSTKRSPLYAGTHFLIGNKNYTIRKHTKKDLSNKQKPHPLQNKQKKMK